MHSNFATWASFACALVIGAGTASAVAGGLSAPQANGWESPAEGGNGDYVYIDTPVAGATVQGPVAVTGRAGTSNVDPNGGGDGDTGFATKPQVVIAMIDTGGNPYHRDFRDPTRLVHPSTYLTGFPANAQAVPLCFIDAVGGAYSYNDDCRTGWAGNVSDDRPVTNGVAVGDLVWYPGTRLMSMSFAHEDTATPVGIDQGGESATSHGSWVSSTAVGNKFGTCPECMLIVLEADTVDAINEAYQWAAEQPWIDVITSSVTVGVIGVGFNPGIFPDKHTGAVKASENGKIFLTSSGNGAGNLGLIPTSTYLYDGSSPAVIPVGASFDDGLASHWSDFPAEIMANGNSRQVADTASMSGETSVGGTSFSSPGAAGVLAKSLLEARRACNDFTEGATATSGGLTLLRNNGCTVTSGPFANGVLTRDELHEAFVKNAVAPYDQLSPIPGPVSWAKNAYGYVDLGHGLNNGGSSIQPAVTQSILGAQEIPARPLEQFWYDSVVREGQTEMWGARPVVDGDGDAFPRADGGCMPDCAPAELQRYAEGFAGLGSGSTYQNLFDVLGVSAEEFARAEPTGFVYRPSPNVGGVIAETGAVTVSNDQSYLTVRLNLAGILDGMVPTIRSNPITYEVVFASTHNGVAQDYRLSYEFQAIDLLALLDGTISEPLVDKFGVFLDTAANEQGTSWICPIDTDLSQSHFDLETNEAVWVIPLTAFNQNNRPVEATATCGFTRDGRGLEAGDTITDITASAVLTVGIVNFGNGLGAFGESDGGDYTLSGGAGDSDGDGVSDDAPDNCPGTPTGADVDANGCELTVSLKVNGQDAGVAILFEGAWGRDINFADYAPDAGAYVLEATFGTATDSVTLVAAGGQPLTVTLSGQCGAAACDENTLYEVSQAAPLSVTLTATPAGGSGEGRKYTFYFGDGTQSQAQDASTVTHEYASANPAGYRVQVVVTEGNATVGATAEMLIKTQSTVTVNPPDVPTEARLTVTPAAGAAPLTVTADASQTQHATGYASTEYEFVFGDGTTVTGSDAVVTHVYTVAGSYTVRVTVKDSDADGRTIGTSSATHSVAVGTGNVLTPLLAVSPTTVKVGEIVTFDGCASFAADGRTITAFTFDPDGPNGNLPAVRQDVSDPVSCDAGHNDASVYRHAYASPGAYRPTLTVTDNEGLAKSVGARVDVAPPKPPQAGKKNGSGAIGLTLLLSLLGAGIARRRRRTAPTLS